MWVEIKVNSYVCLQLQSNHIDWLHKKVPVNFELVSKVPYGWLNIEIWFFHFSSIYCYLQSFCWAVTWCGWCNWNCIRITWGQRCNSNTERSKEGLSHAMQYLQHGDGRDEHQPQAWPSCSSKSSSLKIIKFSHTLPSSLSGLWDPKYLMNYQHSIHPKLNFPWELWDPEKAWLALQAAWFMSSFSVNFRLHLSSCRNLKKSGEVIEKLEDFSLWNEWAGCRLKGGIRNIFPERDT